MNDYLSIWNKRYEIIPNTESWKQYKRWDNGFDHLVFLVTISDGKILSKIRNLQKKISDNGHFRSFPTKEMHITIKPWGFLDGAGSKFNVSPGEFDKAIACIEKRLKAVRAFSVDIKNLNLFKDVVFLEIWDDGNFMNLHKLLLKETKSYKRHREDDNYIPHISIGTYTDNNISGLISDIEKIRNTYIGTLKVGSFDLAIARWNKTAFPVIKKIKRFELI